MQKQVGRSKRKLPSKVDDNLSKYVSIAQQRAKERAKDAIKIIRQSRINYELEHSESPLKERPLSAKSRGGTFDNLILREEMSKVQPKTGNFVTSNDFDLNTYQPSRPGIWDDEVRKEKLKELERMKIQKIKEDRLLQVQKRKEEKEKRFHVGKLSRASQGFTSTKKDRDLFGSPSPPRTKSPHNISSNTNMIQYSNTSSSHNQNQGRGRGIRKAYPRIQDGIDRSLSIGNDNKNDSHNDDNDDNNYNHSKKYNKAVNNAISFQEGSHLKLEQVRKGKGKGDLLTNLKKTELNTNTKVVDNKRQKELDEKIAKVSNTLKKQRGNSKNNNTKKDLEIDEDDKSINSEGDIDFLEEINDSVVDFQQDIDMEGGTTFVDQSYNHQYYEKPPQENIQNREPLLSIPLPQPFKSSITNPNITIPFSVVNSMKKKKGTGVGTDTSFDSIIDTDMIERKILRPSTKNLNMTRDIRAAPATVSGTGTGTGTATKINNKDVDVEGCLVSVRHACTQMDTLDTDGFAYLSTPVLLMRFQPVDQPNIRINRGTKTMTSTALAKAYKNMDGRLPNLPKSGLESEETDTQSDKTNGNTIVVRIKPIPSSKGSDENTSTSSINLPDRRAWDKIDQLESSINAQNKAVNQMSTLLTSLANKMNIYNNYSEFDTSPTFIDAKLKEIKAFQSRKENKTMSSTGGVSSTQGIHLTDNTTTTNNSKMSVLSQLSQKLKDIEEEEEKILQTIEEEEKMIRYALDNGVPLQSIMNPEESFDITDEIQDEILEGVKIDYTKEKNKEKRVVDDFDTENQDQNVRRKTFDNENVESPENKSSEEQDITNLSEKAIIKQENNQSEYDLLKELENNANVDLYLDISLKGNPNYKEIRENLESCRRVYLQRNQERTSAFFYPSRPYIDSLSSSNATEGSKNKSLYNLTTSLPSSKIVNMYVDNIVDEIVDECSAELENFASDYAEKLFLHM